MEQKGVVGMKEMSGEKLLLRYSLSLRGGVAKVGLRGTRRFNAREGEEDEVEKEFEAASWTRAMVKRKMAEVEGLAAQSRSAIKSTLRAFGMIGA